MLLHAPLTEKIIWCFYEVYKQLGFGFLEAVYFERDGRDYVNCSWTSQERSLSK
jgi:hypothetical protein